jgi:hypothetical protein
VKRVAILQSNYLPWKGYFDLISSVDDFVIYDSVQYTRRDWRNRNKIKTKEGLRWITVPVRVKGKYRQTIAETELSGDSWVAGHLAAIRHAYARAPGFAETYPWLEELLISAPKTTISELNRYTVAKICARLGITTRLHGSENFELAEERTARLVGICEQLDADEYVSGPAAKTYMDVGLFLERGIGVRWKSYEGYPAYDQMWPPFEQHVSIIDLMLCTGPRANSFLHSASPFEVGLGEACV